MKTWAGVVAAAALAMAGTADAGVRKSTKAARSRIEAKGRKVHTERSEIAQVARQAMTAVVSITTKNPPEKGSTDEGQRGLGSGFIISPDGYILTSAHVVEGATEITITLLHPEGYTEELPARVVGTDGQTDTSLLKIDTPRKLPTLKLGSAQKTQIADWVVVIGNPFGLSHSVSVGVVSYKGRNDVSPAGRTGYFDYLQTDASINPGNSGGPVLDLNGEVIAIANAVNVAGQGIGFAVPIDIAKTILPQLKSQGYVKRGWIGISVQDMTAEIAATLGMHSPRGVLVSEVVHDGPAYRAGLREGDVITGLDTSEVNRAYSLRWGVASHPLGREVRLQVLRDGRFRQIKVRPGEMPTEESAPEALPEPELATGGSGEAGADEAKAADQGPIGAVVSDVDAASSAKAGLANPFGALIREVEDGGVLSEAGVVEGDVVLKVNGSEVGTRSDFLDTLAHAPKGEVVRLFVRRGEQTLALAFRKP